MIRANHLNWSNTNTLYLVSKNSTTYDSSSLCSLAFKQFIEKDKSKGLAQTMINKTLNFWLLVRTCANKPYRDLIFDRNKHLGHVYANNAYP